MPQIMVLYNQSKTSKLIESMKPNLNQFGQAQQCQFTYLLIASELRTVNESQEYQYSSSSQIAKHFRMITKNKKQNTKVEAIQSNQRNKSLKNRQFIIQKIGEFIKSATQVCYLFYCRDSLFNGNFLFKNEKGQNYLICLQDIITLWKQNKQTQSKLIIVLNTPFSFTYQNYLKGNTETKNNISLISLEGKVKSLGCPLQFNFFNKLLHPGYKNMPYQKIEDEKPYCLGFNEQKIYIQQFYFYWISKDINFLNRIPYFIQEQDDKIYYIGQTINQKKSGLKHGFGCFINKMSKVSMMGYWENGHIGRHAITHQKEIDGISCLIEQQEYTKNGSQKLKKKRQYLDPLYVKPPKRFVKLFQKQQSKQNPSPQYFNQQNPSPQYFNQQNPSPQYFNQLKAQYFNKLSSQNINPYNYQHKNPYHYQYFNQQNYQYLNQQNQQNYEYLNQQNSKYLNPYKFQNAFPIGLNQMKQIQQVESQTIRNDKIPQNEINFSNILNTVIFQKIIYTDDSQYFGEILNKQRHGFGIRIYKDKFIYKGFWCNDLRNGHGILYYPNNQKIIQGEWSNNYKHGKFTIRRGNQASNIEKEVIYINNVQQRKNQ